MALAHNGTVPNYSELIDQFHPRLETAIDSEIFAFLVASFTRSGAGLAQALAQVLALAPLAPHAAVVLDESGSMAVARRPGAFGPGHPLWWAQCPEGVYVCSRRPGPGWQELPDGAACIVPAAA